MDPNNSSANEKPRGWIWIWVLVLGTIFLLCFGIFWEFSQFSIKFNIPQTSEVKVGYQDAYEAPDVTAVFHGKNSFQKGFSLKVSKTGDVDTDQLGTYTETYTAQFLWVKSTAVRTIQVTDVTPPVISLVGDKVISINQGDFWSDPGCSASDDVDGDLTSQVSVKDSVNPDICGTYALIYKVSDSAGNSTTATRTVIVNDVTAPVLTLTGESQMSVKVGAVFTDPGYTVTDNADDHVTVTVDGTVNTSAAGVYALTYTAADLSGNKTTATRIVFVYNEKDGISSAGGKIIYLTFDGGPGKYTGQLLDLLEQYDVKATFFVTGQSSDYQDEIKAEYEAGHTVGIYSCSGDYADIYSSESAFFADIQKMSDICKTETGSAPTLLRFPGGSSNTVSRKYSTGIMTRLTSSVGSRGYQYCDWNVDSGDADNADEAAENIIAGIQKNNISYVRLQDTIDYSTDTVEQIIEWGLANGYTFLPLTSSSPMCHLSVNN